MNPSISFPAGQASLQGGVLETYRGRRYLQLPVLFQSIGPREMEMGGISWRCLKVIFCFIVIQLRAVGHLADTSSRKRIAFCAFGLILLYALCSMRFAILLHGSMDL